MSILSRHHRRVGSAVFRSASASRKGGRVAHRVPVDAQRAVLIAPAFLILSTLLAFRLTAYFHDPTVRRVAGFVWYALVGGVVVPLLVLGRQEYRSLFGSGRRRLSPGQLAGLAIPPILAVLLVSPMVYADARGRIVVMIAGIALLNGVLEETFWRGLFARVFRDDAVRGVLYPALVFALWHVWLLPRWSVAAPPVHSLVVFLAALGIGLIYGWVAWRTGSIRWTSVSHVLLNAAGVSAVFAVRPLA
jgi:membrane protease YdiL (CAAX protease family)